MEGAGDQPVRAQGPNIQKVLDALAKKGVEIWDDGSIRPILTASTARSNLQIMSIAKSR
jgi:hypothetical protein